MRQCAITAFIARSARIHFIARVACPSRFRRETALAATDTAILATSAILATAATLATSAILATSATQTAIPPTDTAIATTVSTDPAIAATDSTIFPTVAIERAIVAGDTTMPLTAPIAPVPATQLAIAALAA
jgi:hypothetical protein